MGKLSLWFLKKEIVREKKLGLGQTPPFLKWLLPSAVLELLCLHCYYNEMSLTSTVTSFTQGSV